MGVAQDGVSVVVVEAAAQRRQVYDERDGRDGGGEKARVSEGMGHSETPAPASREQQVRSGEGG